VTVSQELGVMVRVFPGGLGDLVFLGPRLLFCVFFGLAGNLFLWFLALWLV
jgi:hypothetical protein